MRSRSEVEQRRRAVSGNGRCACRPNATLCADCNGYAERFVRSVKEECLNRIVPLGEWHLWNALHEFAMHYHRERNHHGLANELIERPAAQGRMGAVRRRQRVGGILSYYDRSAVSYLSRFELRQNGRLLARSMGSLDSSPGAHATKYGVVGRSADSAPSTYDWSSGRRGSLVDGIVWLHQALPA